MFPKFKNIGRTGNFLLQEDGWLSFIDKELSESERVETLSRLLSEDNGQRFLGMRNVLDETQAREFKSEHDGWTSIIEHIQAHTTRTTQKNLKRYIKLVSFVETRYSAQPTFLGHELLEEHCPNLERILDDLQEGNHDDNFTGGLLKRLTQQLTEDMSLEYCDPEKCEKAHEKFVNAFQKKFKISVHRWESLGVGLAMYLDQNSHNELMDTIRTEYRALDSFAEDKEYIMLRSGKQEDISYGDCNTPTSRWLFTYAPRPEKDYGALDVLSKNSYKPIKLKQS